MTTKKSSFSRAEIESMESESWQIGSGLDWRKYTKKLSPEDWEQLRARIQSKQSSDQPEEENG